MAALNSQQAFAHLASMENGIAGLPDRTPTQMSEPIGESARRALGDRVPLEIPIKQAQNKSTPTAAQRRWKVVKNTLPWIQSMENTMVEKRRAEPLAGYPAFAEFLGSDERWMICRKFSHFQARLILEKQDEMRLMEEELHDMDLIDHGDTPVRKEKEEPAEKPHKLFSRHRKDGNEDKPKQDKKNERAPKLFTRHRRNDTEAKERKEFFERAEKLYKEYAALLIAAHQLTTFEKPAAYELKSVNRFISKAKPVVEREAGWIGWTNDLVTLRGAREHAYFDAILEAIINKAKNSSWLNKISAEKNIFQRWLTANERTEKWATMSSLVFLSLLVPALFVIPIYALSATRQHIGESIAILTAFTIAFTSVLAAGTPAKAHEVWGCAAAYLAVLVVFLGSVNHSKSDANS